MHTIDNPLSAIDDWPRTELGRHIVGLEQQMVDQLLPDLFGFHLMQMGFSTDTPLYANSMIRHRFTMAPAPGRGQVSALSDAEALPIDSDSIDVLILHHALEFSANPHQLLREAARVVVPHGHVLILGFNPWSLLSARALLSRRFGHPVWRFDHLSARRVSDWLRLLDFNIDSVHYSGHALPVNHQTVLAHQSGIERLGSRWSLPWGARWMIHACKQVNTMTPVRPFKRMRAPRLAVPFAAPSARHRTLH